MSIIQYSFSNEEFFLQRKYVKITIYLRQYVKSGNSTITKDF